MLWIRAASLVIGKKQYTLDGLDFSFEVPFEDSDEPPVATVKVTNLSAVTRAGIVKGDTVVLNAGYEGDVGCLLIGKVVGLKHKQSNVDWTSTLTVQPCADEILGKSINKTYAEGSKASDIVRDMLNIFGVEVAKCELTTDTVYSRGRVCRGNLKQVLTEIVVNECKSRFIIRATGQVYITKANGGIDNGILLTTSTGLLRSDEEKVVIPVEDDLNSQTTSEDKDGNTVSRSCLLNYRIATAEVVKIQSSDLNGRFIVKEGKHVGSRSGDWETTIELLVYNTQTSSSSSSSGSGYSVGDTVTFTGNTHYVSSTGDVGYSARTGPAKITKINKGAKHPYHLIHTDSTSNVYGWVNEGDFS